MNKVYFLFSLLSFAFVYFIPKQDSSFQTPSYFPKPYYDFKKNPLSESKIALGRKLFYDPRLSRNGSISCANCHSPYNAFAHTDHALSHGIDDSIGTRNAPALFNLAWQPLFMWDGAINHLDMQSLFPITHPKEMGENFTHLIEKLNKDSTYQELCYEAYHNRLISGEYVLKSLSQFMLSLVSTNAKYDSVQLHQALYTEQEQRGHELFLLHCNSCHTEPLFTNFSFQNNGLPVDTFLNDSGRYLVTKKSSDSLCFKVPSLRNLEYTYPYMHDGRFANLQAVIKHYINEKIASPTLSNLLIEPITLNDHEQIDLIAFLLTLNDPSFVFNKKYAYPKN
ncbi:MAG: cytochrome c peroxidase [Chitinophagaceae bacterium]